MMMAAFLSGWFYMVTKAVENPEGKENLIPEFASGVGEYFLPILVKSFLKTVSDANFLPSSAFSKTSPVAKSINLPVSLSKMNLAA